MRDISGTGGSTTARGRMLRPGCLTVSRDIIETGDNTVKYILLNFIHTCFICYLSTYLTFNKNNSKQYRADLARCVVAWQLYDIIGQ